MKSPANTQKSLYSITKATIIHQVGRVPFLGATLRWFARRYPEGSIVTIKSGYLAGYKWMRSHRDVNAYWVGDYELPIQKCLIRDLKPGDVFYDIGANAGFFSLLGSKCVGPQGHVFAFEPLPENIETLKSNLDLNEIKNCTVVEAAVCDSVGTVGFCQGPHTSMAYIKRQGNDGQKSMLVKALTLDEFAKTERPPNLIKMDVEGAEILALRGASALLKSATPPRFLIELHGDTVAAQAREILEKSGYWLYTLDLIGIGSNSMPRHILAYPGNAFGDRANT